MTGKGKVLFVDDERRVLNSMRGLFRRDYELLLTTDGAEAVRLVAENDIDVLVADQRMPGMSGVEVLGKVRELSPRTIRILLTGYADPEAIEGSINIGEVFRFLSKPCPPAVLRETLKLAVEAARAAPEAATGPPVDRTPAPAPPRPEAPTTEPPPVLSTPAAVPPPPSRSAAHEALPTLTDTRHEPAGATRGPEHPAAERPAAPLDLHTEIVMSGDTSQVRQLGAAQEATNRVRSVGVAIFTVNPKFAESAIRTISLDRNATLATTLVKVAEVLEQRQAGVLVTDFTSDTVLLQNMIGTLKQHLPELVTIVVSDNRDATDMINLINYGQVFRYVEKPIDSQALRTDVNAAVLKHLQLLEHPELIQRHQVVNLTTPTEGSPTFNQFIGKVTRLRGRWTNITDKSH